ncbi:MAG TPA: glycosyltransferase family 39 protein [Vicinamibacterales bacterium]|nr:glycosyltransferase family 39 protein [Vicinamibacterales bacterium]
MTDRRMRRAATIRHHAGAACAAAACIAVAWSAILALSGGISVHTGVSRFVARDPIRPLYVAAAFAGIAWPLLGTPESRRLLRRLAGDAGRLPARVAAVAAAATLVVSIAWSTRAAGGSDSSCYVLQAEAFAHGRASLPPPLPLASAIVPPAAFAPIGFVPSPAPPHDAVPICAAGLALAMVPAALVSRDAVFLVVPLFAVLAVWCTFRLGRALHSDLAGAGAAVLLACSPIFLYQAVQPMSDVPAAALWLAALVGLSAAGENEPARGRAAREIAAGLCASAAVLMRPNMAVLALPLLALLPWRAASWLRFAGASLPALAAMLALNAVRYGSPLASGYGATDVLFALAHVGPNLSRYPRWLFETHTPLVALAAIAPLLPWRREQRRIVLVAAASAALTVATYLAYTVFDDWWYLRFLLPALPPMLVLAMLVVMRLLQLLPRVRPWAIGAAAAVVVLTLGAWFVHVAGRRAVFELAILESRFRLAGDYAGRALTEQAVVLAVQQSGSVRYYGRRASLTWDAIAADRLDEVIDALRASGRVAIFALEDAEQARFRARFRGQRYGRLDWAPFAEVHAPTRVRFFDPRQRAPFQAGERYPVEIVGRVGRR